ncbi:branched-chain amino acid dehydrogenase [Deinococcus aetherius]|uniref:Branched-chain amino acid dehydrogenase n=1 Tax=Deinococcus aetherius TaxID=200252 RepID=A0ABN6RCX8_9DEIO|nr:Glu/Leu/Phe/Val dehydrogenase dimerization domain-containing protein [Deinococcus aetherius]BDP40635.1 branched-chain amino acid dehydrogenase [Deinococcus aetherius]
MLIFEEMQSRGHEALTLLHHAPSGLRAALAIHSTVLGPAIAGVRLRPLDEETALRGALALSESLTLKAALAGLNYGGGACVLMLPEVGVDDPHAREALFRALGRQVRPLESRVVLTEDIGVTPRDIAFVAQETPSTLGVNTDTSSVTGYGVYRGIKAAARSALGSESMRGVRVAVLGVGAVGRTLAEHLHREGARLTVADNRPERAETLADELDGVTVTGTEELFDVPCDVFSPCGYGHSVRSTEVPRLQCRLIAGGEHHPLTRRGEDAVREAGIMYIPDFAINAAGLIAAATSSTPEQAAERVYATVTRIVAVADQYGKPPHVVARRMAERRIDLIGSLGTGGAVTGRGA